MQRFSKNLFLWSLMLIFQSIQGQIDRKRNIEVKNCIELSVWIHYPFQHLLAKFWRGEAAVFLHHKRRIKTLDYFKIISQRGKMLSVERELRARVCVFPSAGKIADSHGWRPSHKLPTKASSVFTWHQSNAKTTRAAAPTVFHRQGEQCCD